MIDFKQYILSTIIALPLIFNVATALAGNLTINVKNIRGTQGKLQVAVFDQAKAFDKSDIAEAYAVMTLPINSPANLITLHDVPTGKYAISLFHDENNNNDFETNITGMPTEGYGTSKAKDKYDEPSFAEAGVSVGEDDEIAIVEIFYMGTK